MADFNEVLASIRQTVGEETLPPEITEPLVHEYISVQDALSGATTQLNEKNERIQTLEGEVSRLKSANYDLTVIAGATQPKQNDPEENKPRGIEGLFQPKKRT